MYMYMYVECVFSEIVCSTLCFHDFVCMHLLLDQFFDDFLKFQKLKQPLYTVPSNGTHVIVTANHSHMFFRLAIAPFQGHKKMLYLDGGGG